MIRKIIHLSDVHLMNKLEYQTRQEVIVENTIESIKKQNPDRIVIVGDLFHDFIKPNNETKVLAGKFLNELAKICKVIITQGNHDLNMKSVSRTDSVKVVVNLLNNPNIHYLDRTFFYDDDNVVWSVWHHSDKTSPWVKNPDYKKQKNKLYIDLFHDPINSSKTYFGQTFDDEKYVSLSDFKGDLLMMGDIHQYQLFYNDDRTLKGAYPSSLYQNNYGESVDEHGYIVWNIEDVDNIQYEHVEVENEYTYINYHLSVNNGDIDYDNLDIELNKEFIKKYTHVKIKWTDYSSNINIVNWRKIKEYINNKYGSNIVELKKDETKLFSNKIEDNDYIKKSLPKITSVDVQQEIFRNFLKEKKYDDEFIEEVINIDNKINNRIGSFSSIERKDWRLVSFYLENYRSHGDRFEMNWDKQNGIYQIMGENAVGKTNLLSSIMYLFFGKTLETLKKESNGDNRFINNKRNLDFCEVGGIIDIEGSLYSIIRRTERKWDRTKTKITGSPTTIVINQIDVTGEVVNQTDEEKSKTQKFVESVIGTFDDFLSLYLVNADTLNNLLSVDESVFIDTILRYSGLDIFEKKLNEYKEYKKELYKKEDKIVLNIDDEQSKIYSIKSDIEDKKQEVIDLTVKLNDSQERLKKGQSMKEEEIKKLQQIDQKLINTPLSSVETEINNLVGKKDEFIKLEKELEFKISELKDTYDVNKYNSLIAVKDELQKEYYTIKSSIKESEHKIDSLKNEIAVCNGNVLQNNRAIENNNKAIEQEIVNLKSKIEIKKQQIDLINKNIDNKIKNIQNEISTLETSKICPSCDRTLGKEQVTVIQSKISDKQNEIKELEKTKDNTDEILEIKTDIAGIEMQIESRNSLTIINLKTKNDELLANNTLQEENKVIHSNNILEVEKQIETLKENLENNSIKTTENQELILEVEKEKQEFDRRNELVNQKNNIPLQLENLDLKINNNRTLYNNIIKENEKYENNQKIQVVIDTYEARLKTLMDNVNNIQSNISYIQNNEIVGMLNNIKQIEDRIEKFKKQEREELINKTYVECIHRDGLPKLLLLRMRDDINQEIHNLINGLCNFNLFFDENMVLKMYTCNEDNAIQNVIGGSGMERTFISIILRLALRDVNNKSLGNFLFLDEITGKLVGDSVTNFFELVQKIKQKIDKIVIIEHAYSDELQVDYSLTVTAENGVSKIEM